MHEVIDIKTENRQLGEAGRKAYIAGVGAAIVGLAGSGFVALTAGGPARLLWSYLVSYAFFLSLALGALFFVLLQHLTHAGWSVVLRRLAEAIAANLPVLAALALPLVLGAGTVYEWTRPGAFVGEEALLRKTAYLNLPFFTARLVVYFAIWGGFGWWFFRRSVRQDASGDAADTLALERRAPIAMVLFALTTTFAAFDLLMSLDPRWSSTVYGVYFFAGAVTGFLALLAIVMLLVQRAGRLTRAITVEHWHDVGKLLFAFVVFWAYIAFCQFLLMWYGNLPEETIWWKRRVSGGWGAVSVVLLAGCFVIPFVGLLSRGAKRRPGRLVAFAVWLLVMHYVDLYWLVLPEMSRDAVGVVPVSFGDVSVFLMLGGLLVALTARRLSRCSLVAEGDPRLAESLAFENV